MSEHTATPWRIGDAGNTVFGPPSSPEMPEIVASLSRTKRMRANGAFIVRAVNAHDELVAAAESAAEYLTDGHYDSAHAVWRRLDLAIAKANGN